MSYVDVDWTSEQVDFALQMALNKFLESSEDMKVTVNEYSRGEYRIQSSKFYITISSENRVFMILNNQSAGSYRPSGWFWKDKAVKKTMKTLYGVLSSAEKRALAKAEAEKNKYKKETAMKSLFDAFPEAITEEFEKHVLESKNGKEDSEEN